MRFFGGFGISIGIRFASVEPSIFGSFFGCVPETAVGELISNGGRPRGGQAGEGDSLSGTSLERIGSVVGPYAKRQAFGLARRIGAQRRARHRAMGSFRFSVRMYVDASGKAC